MSMFYRDYDKARAAITNMDEADLLSQIDVLYGRDNLSANYTLEELRLEVYAQVKLDFTNTSSRELVFVGDC